jgi:hypothetical protein
MNIKYLTAIMSLLLPVYMEFYVCTLFFLVGTTSTNVTQPKHKEEEEKIARA